MNKEFNITKVTHNISNLHQLNISKIIISIKKPDRLCEN